MKTYTRNGAASPANPMAKKKLYEAIHFWRGKIAHIMDRYYPAYHEAEELFGKLVTMHEQVTFEKTGKLPGEKSIFSDEKFLRSTSWPDSLWKELVSPLKSMHVDLDTIYQSVDKDIFRSVKSQIEAEQVNRFDRALGYLGVAVVASKKAMNIDIKKAGSDPGERAVLQIKMFKMFKSVLVPLWTSLVMSWSALFFATADIVNEIKQLDENETDVWHKQIDYIQEKFVKRESESLKEFLERVLRESQVVRKGETDEVLRQRLNDIKFVKSVVESADGIASNKATIVQVFDSFGEIVYVGTPTEMQIASEVANHIRAQHLPRASTWEWMARGSNIVSHGKTFARPLTIKERLAAQTFVASEVEKSKAYKELIKESKKAPSHDAAERFRKVAWLKMREDQYREMPTVSIDEIAKAIDVPLKWEVESRIVKSREKAEEREAEKVIAALETTSAEEKKMTPNSDMYMEDLSMLRALWQMPMVVAR